MASISVIIPTLNEAANISALLTSLIKQKAVDLELIVADGGSSDETLELVQDFDVKIVNAPKGRAAQMNAAVELATKDFLFFLHADSTISDLQLLENALVSFGESKNIAGHFSIKFLREKDERSLAYFYYEEKTKLNRRNTFNGDQGLLISKEYFSSLGGFDESLPFLEDQGLALKIRDSGRLVTLPGVIKTSARRFESEGLARRMILNAMIMALFANKVQEFFEQAPAVYREQSDSARLRLSPFFTLIHNQFVSLGFFGACRRWCGIGKYVKENAWQLAFYCDVLRIYFFAGKNRSCLKFYDRFISPVLNFKLFNVVAAIVTAIWFYSSLLYFKIADS